MSKHVPIGKTDEFPIGQVRQIGVQGTVLLVARLDDSAFCAVLDECSHMTLPIGEVSLKGTTITCPHHGSEFDICTGQNLDWIRRRSGVELPRWIRRLMDRGQTPRPLTTVPVMVEDGLVYVNLGTEFL
jgi:nitrite reductase/ring-hydroxylating ferredoxin subunit